MIGHLELAIGMLTSHASWAWLIKICHEVRFFPDVSVSKCNYCYIFDVITAISQVSLEAMVHAGVHCVKPEYIAMYLSEVPLPSPTDHYVPQVQQFVRSVKHRTSC